MVLVMPLAKSDVSLEMTAVVIEVLVAEAATVVDAAEIVVAVVAIAVDAVVTEADAAEIAADAAMIEDHVENDVTSTMMVAVVKIEAHVLIGLTETAKATEIAAHADQRVDMMAVTVDQVHHADAKLSN